jgi:hypothetical protein
MTPVPVARQCPRALRTFLILPLSFSVALAAGVCRSISRFGAWVVSRKSRAKYQRAWCQRLLLSVRAPRFAWLRHCIRFRRFCFFHCILPVPYRPDCLLAAWFRPPLPPPLLSLSLPPPPSWLPPTVGIAIGITAASIRTRCHYTDQQNYYDRPHHLALFASGGPCLPPTGEHPKGERRSTPENHPQEEAAARQ